MTDWGRAYSCTYEFWIVDRATWRDRERLPRVSSCSITRDLDGDLAESARIVLDDPIREECYIRCYLAAEQDGRVERECLGTWLAQTPTVGMDGKSVEREIEAYSPLVELRDDMPEIGFTANRGEDPCEVARRMCEASCSAPVVAGAAAAPLDEPYTAGDGETCLDYVSGLLALAGMRLAVTPYGEISFAPVSPAASLRPAATYADGADSVMGADVEVESDWYGLPNVVEVVLSGEAGCTVGTAENASDASALSTSRRMRRVVHRVTNPPDLPATASKAAADAYASALLEELSAVEQSATFEHAYDGSAVGEGVRIAYSRHGFDMRGASVRQEIECGPACAVSETVRNTQGI